MITISNKYDSKRRTITIGRWSFWWPFPVVMLTHSSAAMVFGWPVFGANAPRFIRGAHDVFRHISNAKYWLRYRLHPGHQYHLVRTGLKPNYWDADTRMLHACMALLCEVVEEEGGVAEVEKYIAEISDSSKRDPNAPEGSEDSWVHWRSEMLAIYRWWKIGKPADEKRRNELMHGLFGGGNRRLSFVPMEGSDLLEMKMEPFTDEEEARHTEMRALEKKIEDDEQKMLHRLIDIRGSLWT